MERNIPAVETKYKGQSYRSRTEARWAVFLTELGVSFEYEPEALKLPSSEVYLPDFYIHDFDAYIEVKPNSHDVVVQETKKALELSTNIKSSFWLALGAPDSNNYNIFVLSDYGRETLVEDIIRNTDNAYRFLEDRRDERIYWLEAKGQHHHFSVGGPGVSTDHDRFPELHKTVEKAYEAVKAIDFKKTGESSLHALD